MLPQELDTSTITNNDFKDVVFGRRSVRSFDTSYKVPREEILQMIQEAVVASPSAVDTQPFHFLVIDTDEGKDKMDDIMWMADKDRTNRCSFTIIPCADAKWFEHFDDHIAREKEATPEFWGPELESMLVPLTMQWIDLLCEGDASYLHKSVDFQAGLVTMSLLYIFRAHGLDAGFMDAWDPQLLEEAFGLDLDRFRPQGAIAVGKKAAVANGNTAFSEDPARYRYPAEELTEFA